ncbi:MAG TPA: rRNA maturation RNase YbeY [Sedimentisphaerales bacterium]|nr:rRNA maturation RNase YbeY [Sedimentisphaerales bacterium]
MDSLEQGQGIVVQIAKNFKEIDLRLPKLKKLVIDICGRFRLSKAMVSIAIVGNAEIRKVNGQFLGHDCTTDCLSFDLSDGEEEFENRPERLAKCFELVVNGEKALKEARTRGHSSEAELALYITHALLHNFGFDDCTGEQAKKMHQTEDEILQQHGYGSVYNTDNGQQDT